MPSNTIDLEFADGEYTFALPLERIDELQIKCGIGIGGLYARVIKGFVRDPVTGQVMTAPGAAEFYALDLIETLRQGLIGGGKGIVNGAEVKVTPQVANQLLRNYVLDRPLNESWSMAAAILGACIIGYDPPKKDEPPVEGATGETTTERDASTTA